MNADRRHVRQMMTVQLLELVTLTIPVVLAAEAGATQEELNPMATVVKFLGLHSDSDADLALIAASVETARWVIVAAENQGADPAELWAEHVQGRRHG